MNAQMNKRFEFIINTFYFAILLGIAYLVFTYGISLLMPFIVAIAIVSLIQPIIRFIQKKFNIKHPFLSFIILLILYIAIGSALIFLLVKAFQSLFQTLTYFPDYFQTTLLPTFNDIIAWLESRISEPIFNELFSKASNSLLDWVQQIIVRLSQVSISIASNFTKNIAGNAIGFLFTIMLSFSINIQYDKVIRFLKYQIPENWSTTLSKIVYLIKNVIGSYLQSYAILLFITFCELTLGLFILGTPNAIPIALGIALLDILPIFGTGTILVPWIIIELFQQNWSVGVGLAIMYILITIVRQIIEPKVVGRQLGLNPIISLLSIYLGYRLFGFIGMIFFPMAIQILLELHNDGTLKLYKSLPEDTDMKN